MIWPKMRHLLHLIILIFLGALVYSNTLHVPFVFDDLPNIKNNQNIAIQHLNFQELREAAFSKPSSHRPVANISFALDYYFSGYSLPVFHLTNIIIHILTGLILYQVIFLTLSLRASNNRGKYQGHAAFFAAAIWLVNPINTQAVTYLVQRMATLAALFYIFALLFFIKARVTDKRHKAIYYGVGSFIAGVLAVGSKENAITLPFALLLYDFIFFKEGRVERFRELIPYFIGTLFFLVIAATLYLGDNFWSAISSGYSTRDFSMSQRLLSQFRVVLYYLSQFFMPYPGRLNLDHDFLISQSLFRPWTTFPAIVTVCTILVVSIGKAARSNTVSFCIIWFFLNLLVESSFIPLEMFFEHRVYLPSMFLGLLLVFFSERLFAEKRSYMFLVAIFMLFSLWTYERNQIWQNELTLWSDVVAKSPQKARGYNEIGMYYFEHRQQAKAIPFFQRTLLLDNDQAISHNNLGLCFLASDKVDLAITEFKEAIRIIPEYGMFHVNLGIAYMQKGSLAKGRYELSLGKKLQSAE